MIMVDTLAEMQSRLPPCACVEMATMVEEYADNNPANASFSELFGGPILIVETMEDVGHIPTPENYEGRPGTLLDHPSGSFDVAEWICGTAFARFVVIDMVISGHAIYYASDRRVDLSDQPETQSEQTND